MPLKRNTDHEKTNYIQMKKNHCILFLFKLFVLTSSAPLFAFAASNDSISIPFGGNAFIQSSTLEHTENINDKGLNNWSDAKTKISIFFRVEEAGLLNLALKLKTDANSKIKVTVLTKSFEKDVISSNFNLLPIGEIKISRPGYVQVDIQGLSKSGATFAEVSDLIVSADKKILEGISFVKSNKDGGYHFGRRGPSVHLKYEIPESIKNKVEWFYNEITVPIGEDVIGSYYMANGFNGGYFGMQANSEKERRILFSIWSTFVTDDPKSIPDSLKIKVLKKGEHVRVNEFGNEGSGGQSYTVYPWKAGTTYSFLTRAQPSAQGNNTVFTSYFKEASTTEWLLIASFERPQANVNLKGLYSFLENFNPSTGLKERKVNFGNQWAIDTEGNWYEITAATFTADNTAKQNFRKDYAGGVSGKVFYLRNCGFFNDHAVLNQTFKRELTAKVHPKINFSKLP